MKTYAQAPGKLFLAGEYAITLAGQQSLVMAMDRYVTVELDDQPTSPNQPADTLIIHSDQMGTWSLTWATLLQTPAPEGFNLIRQTLITLQTWLDYQNIDLVPMTISVRSALVQDQKKLGLGSSAAIVCALIKAFGNYYQLALTPIKLYKLGVLTTFTVDRFQAGSMGDLAAAAFGGLILYQRFDTVWLSEQLGQGRFASLVDQPWPLLLIKSISFPSQWHLLVGWTGQPADTQAMLAINPRVARLYQAQLAQKTRPIIQQLTIAIEEADFLKVMTCLHLNQTALIRYAKAMHLPYLTDRLRTLLAIAQQHGAATKISGAGGGDNGLAITHDPEVSAQINAAWRRQGIIPLTIALAPQQGEEVAYD